MYERGDGVGEQLIEELAMMSRAEVAEQMMVDPHAATEPHAGQVALGQPRELTASMVANIHRAVRIFGSTASRPALPSTAWIF